MTYNDVNIIIECVNDIFSYRLGFYMGYRDNALPARERAKDLLKQMTLREKVGQLNQKLYGFGIYRRNGSEIELTEDFCSEVEKWGGLGVLYGLYRADPWSEKDEETGIVPEISMNAYNTVQKYVIEHSRLGIPMLLSTECPHGHQAIGGGLLPVNTALGATFNEQLVEDAYKACGKQLGDGHVDFALMSVLDVLRDPRWGRSEECYSEDPYLSANMARHAVRGMQSSGVYAVAKHLCAQGEGTGGVNASAASIGERELRDIHLQTAREVCKEHVKGVMAAYNEIDGIYCHANEYLLKEILCDEYGFDGIVMADGFAVDALDKVTGDNTKSGALALSCGVDVSLWDNGFTRLEEAVEKGYISEKLIDAAVLKVLTIKFERGLFENPYMQKNMEDASAYGINELSEKLAEQSFVLLKNEGLLPLNASEFKKIAVIGPNADSIYALAGDYTPPITDKKCKSIYGALKELFAGSGEVDWLDPVWTTISKSPDKLKEYDLLVVVGGGSSSRYEGVRYDINGAAIEGASLMDCGEGVDLCQLKMQGDLEQRIRLFGQIPVLTVCVAGRPYVIDELEKESSAVIYAFYPGPYAAEALMNLIEGKVMPSGRLPVSLPKSAAQLPVYYNYKESYAAMKYIDMEAGPLHVFGEGKSYGKVRYEDVVFTVREDNIKALKEETCVITISCKIVNESAYGVWAVPQIYIHRTGGDITSRIRELKGYQKIYVEAGDSVQIELELTADKLYFYKKNMHFGLGKCRYEVLLMDNNELLGKGELVLK